MIATSVWYRCRVNTEAVFCYSDCSVGSGSPAQGAVIAALAGRRRRERGSEQERARASKKALPEGQRERHGEGGKPRPGPQPPSARQTLLLGSAKGTN